MKVGVACARSLHMKVLDDAITIYQTDDRNITYTNCTNIKHASMRSYDYSAGASLYE